MTARTHDVIATAALITFAAVNPPDSLNLTTAVACVVGGVIGALAPDLDQATNRLWDMLPIGNFFGQILRGIFLGHRTISHSIVGIVVFYKILELIIPKLLNPDYVNASLVAASIMIGFISHILADMLTKEGVPLLFPLPIKIGFPPLKQLRITTGKFTEKFIVFPGVIVYILWLVTEKKEPLLNLVKLIRS